MGRRISPEEKQLRVERDSRRFEREIEYWYGLKPGDTVRVGCAVYTVTRVTPTHVVTGDFRWKPSEIGLGRMASSKIRLNGEASRKQAALKGAQ